MLPCCMLLVPSWTPVRVDRNLICVCAAVSCRDVAFCVAGVLPTFAVPLLLSPSWSSLVVGLSIYNIYNSLVGCIKGMGSSIKGCVARGLPFQTAPACQRGSPRQKSARPQARKTSGQPGPDPTQGVPGTSPASKPSSPPARRPGPRQKGTFAQPVRGTARPARKTSGQP